MILETTIKYICFLAKQEHIFPCNKDSVSEEDKKCFSERIRLPGQLLDSWTATGRLESYGMGILLRVLIVHHNFSG